MRFRKTRAPILNAGRTNSVPPSLTSNGTSTAGWPGTSVLHLREGAAHAQLNRQWLRGVVHDREHHVAARRPRIWRDEDGDAVPDVDHSPFRAQQLAHLQRGRVGIGGHLGALYDLSAAALAGRAEFLHALFRSLVERVEHDQEVDAGQPVGRHLRGRYHNERQIVAREQVQELEVARRVASHDADVGDRLLRQRHVPRIEVDGPADLGPLRADVRNAREQLLFEAFMQGKQQVSAETAGLRDGDQVVFEPRAPIQVGDGHRLPGVGQENPLTFGQSIGSDRDQRGVVLQPRLRRAVRDLQDVLVPRHPVGPDVRPLAAILGDAHDLRSLRQPFAQIRARSCLSRSPRQSPRSARTPRLLRRRSRHRPDTPAPAPA